jgi:predicted nuclease of predicted toxin-antitoxin system
MGAEAAPSRQVKLLLDEHHSPRIAAELVKVGFDVVAGSSQPHTRNITDEELLEVAAADRRVLVTENVADFMVLATRWAADQRKHSGIVLTHHGKFNRSRSSYPGSLIRALSAFLKAPPPAGDSWVWWL